MPFELMEVNLDFEQAMTSGEELLGIGCQPHLLINVEFQLSRHFLLFNPRSFKITDGDGLLIL